MGDTYFILMMGLLLIVAGLVLSGLSYKGGEK